MDNPQIDALIEKIKRVEATCYVWRVLAIGAFSLMTLILMIVAMQREGNDKILVARDFVVVDSTGRALIRLGQDHQARGKAALEFLDIDGERRIAIGVNNANAPYISLTDSDAEDQLLLDVRPQEGSAIAFRNRRSRSGLLLAAGPPGVAALGFMDKDGQRLFEMGLEPDGAGRLTLRSKEGKKLFEVP